jgi:hypothetical protein
LKIINDSYTLTDPTACVGEATTLSMSGSEIGVTYQLRLDSDDTPVGAPVAGTGAGIDFAFIALACLQPTMCLQPLTLAAVRPS